MELSFDAGGLLVIALRASAIAAVVLATFV